MTVDQLRDEIARQHARANLGCKAWSAVFHVSFGISTVAGAVIATISGKNSSIFGIDLADYIPVIALAGSICSAVGIFGGFERKWRANRITRNELEILRLELAKKDGSSNEVDAEIKELINILRMHDAAILQLTVKPERLPADPASSSAVKPVSREGSTSRMASSPEP